MYRRALLGTIGSIGVLGSIGINELPLAAAQTRQRSPSATVRFTETFDRPASWSFEAATPVDDGVVICGWEAGTEPFTGEAVLAKVDSDGSIAWETTITGDADTYALWDVATVDGGYAAVGGLSVAGRTAGLDADRFADAQLLVVFDETGQERWRQQLDADTWVHSVFGLDDRVVVGRDNELRQFRDRNDQDRPVPIDQEPDRSNDFVLTYPAAVTRHDGRVYIACTRTEGFVDDDNRRQIPLREPLLLELVDDPLRIIDSHRIRFEQNHWVSDLAVVDDGYYVAGGTSPRETFDRDPEMDGWLLHVDFDGERQWYETVPDEAGLRFTGLEANDTWDGLLASGQVLDHGRAYLVGTNGESIDQLYEQDNPGVLTDVASTDGGAAMLTGAVSGRDDDPFVASIAVDPPADDLQVTVDPESGAVGEPIEFTAAVVGDWEPASIEWAGAVDGTGNQIETTFDEPGEYETTVTVRTQVGGTVERTAQTTIGSAAGDEEEGADDSIPGFGVPAAVAGLAGGAAAYALRNREREANPDE